MDRPRVSTEMAAELQSRVLHRDNQIVILDKPAGLAVHPGPKTPESLEGYLPGLRFGLTEPPIPAHRLDRDTSGCLVLARNARARRRLGRLFTAGLIEKTYWAVVEGHPAENTGEIKLALTKRSGKNGWRMVPCPTGQEAETRYRVLLTQGGKALLELTPLTGRTHQIRVHCTALGCPIVGDPVYGTGITPPPHLLHARRLVIPLAEAAPVIVTAPIPDRIRAAFSNWPSTLDAQ